MKTFVVVPVGDDLLRLRWCLEGLARQTDDNFTVVLAVDAKDKDSKEHVAAVVDNCNIAMTGIDLEIVALAPLASGFRPSETRNLVAQFVESENDLLIFLDADCVPDEGFVDAHQQAHGRAHKRLVFGFRRHVPEQAVAEFPGHLIYSNLIASAAMEARQHCLPEVPSCWEVYSCNMSVRAGIVASVGGFDKTFDGGVGGCDSDLAARLVRAGADLVPLIHTGYVTHLNHPKQWTSEPWAESMVQASKDGQRDMIANGGPLALGKVAATSKKPQEETVSK